MSSTPVTIAPFEGTSVCLFCGSSDTANPEYTVAARAFGVATAAQGWRLVYGGGGVGLMGALMRHSGDEGMTPASFLDAWVVCDTVEAAIAAIRDAGSIPALQHDRR